jgi:FkbM family methyltransferase
MLISLDTLVEKYNIKFQSILHVGAHLCEEINDYEKYVSRDKILWVEAIPSKVEESKEMYPDILIEQAVVSDVEEMITFNVSNNGQSSSMLQLALHQLYHPDIHYVDSFQCKTKLLYNITSKYSQHMFNFINLDIQGTELKALKGLSNYLCYVDYIYVEVNLEYLYKDCCIVYEIDQYLRHFGFIRVETKMTACNWGDSFYLKANLLQQS